MENHGSEEETDAFSTAVNCTGQTSSLPREVEVEIQSQQMFENIRSHLPNCLLRDASKDRIAEFLEKCSSNSRYTI
jgi:hypothetical protein